MAQLTYISDLYQVETDGEDWPKGLPEAEREVLKASVLRVLDLCHPLNTYDLYYRVSHDPEVAKHAPVFHKAALLDWLYGCVVRAARAADCEQRWHAPTKHAPEKPKPEPAEKPKRSRKGKPEIEFSAEEKSALDEAARIWGRNRWRTELRLAWESGNYGPLKHVDHVLQRIRNTHGNKALDAFKPTA